MVRFSFVRQSGAGVRTVQGKSCTGKVVCVSVYAWVHMCGGKSMEEDFLELVFFLYLGSALGAKFRLLCSQAFLPTEPSQLPE